MRGLVFDPRPARLVAAGALSRIDPLWALSGPGPLGLRRLPDPEPPGPGWVSLEPRFTGVCGSDVTQATLQADWDNPLSGMVSFPHVMGHEVVARVLDAAGTGFAAGELVVVNPWLGCAARGLDPCPACAEGLPSLCTHQGEPLPGVSGTGIHTGNIRGLPGGMGTRMVAQHAQLHRLPDALDPRAGVLADPVAVGLHAAERAAAAARGGDGTNVIMVIGAGTIGLAVAASLAHLHAGRVLVGTAWPYQRPLVAALGAEPIPHQPQAALRHVAEATGGRITWPWRGLPWLVAGGAAAVVDAVGSAATAELALAVVRPGGTVVRVGVGRARRTQATLTYFKEVAVVGSNGYRRQDLDTALEMLADGEIAAGEWLTHRFPLDEWRRAFRIAARPQDHAAIKVSIDIREGLTA